MTKEPEPFEMAPVTPMFPMTVTGFVNVTDQSVGSADTRKPLVRVPACALGLVTTTFHEPVTAPVMGQLPEESVVEFVNEKPVQEMLLWPDLVSFTVAPDTNPAPTTEVTDTEAVLRPEDGSMPVTVGDGASAQLMETEPAVPAM